MSLLKLANNNKRYIFAAGVIGFGGQYLKTEYDINVHMRKICSEIKNFENKGEPIPKQILVILNPVANKKKAEARFQKYCEPLLHLAGFSVNIVNTQSIGHAKTYVENLSTLPDTIVIAGGNGTASEVVTGLMRRKDKPCPIAIIPLGIKERNSNKLDYVKDLSNAVLPMVQKKLESRNVIKYDVINNNLDENSTKHPKPIYGLDKFSWGVLRDIDSVKDKYWYFGFLKHYAAAFFNAYSKDVNWHISTNFVYTPPCPGCNNCSIVQKPSSKFTFRRFLPAHVENEATQQHKENKECTTEIRGHIDSSQLDIVCQKNEDSFFELQAKFLESLSPGIDFIKEIPKVTKNHIEPSLVLKSRTIQLSPDANTREKAYFSIDGEEYDVRPIKISLMPNAIQLYIS